MPTAAVLPLPAGRTLTEPVTLDQLREWCRVEPGQDTLTLELLRTAAREKVEAYTGRYFAGGQRVALTFELAEAYALPAGATAVSVSGFFTALADLTAWSLEEYRKGISINRQLPWGEALAQTYTVVADLADALPVPDLARAAVLELAAEWYRNRESASTGTISPELPVNWRVKLAELRVKPIAY